MLSLGSYMYLIVSSTAAIKTSVRQFLFTVAIRVNETFDILADNLAGGDYDSTQIAPASYSPMQGDTITFLLMGITCHYEYLNAEQIHLNAVNSNDTVIVFGQGAQHGIYTCTDCESYPGEFGDTVRTCFDYVTEWLGKSGRFL
ncbi:hypothetical protein BO94DRAFT_588869 [Aspergillus sclerotioniger CBS 115572]|uniref:Uncharacterized protein n=1 Tax=Aspergillus sclerotioniger CBS 115572 TaxID=1450535 RepID=A0A317VRU4_9EURO|nr:hypothetical protein BO94DRAFT_588869 [Aspergillus sclerotioniger CBS 115572]PWY76011.1 hypothetical protein BO94DRAFT_588869 [Aspergillus sclerotioniger CBS 115572]